MQLQPFLSLAVQFKAVFLDSYGVLKNFKGLIEGVQDTITFLREKDIAIRVLTNDASRSQEQQVESFARLGLTGLQTHEVITSGMMAKHFLQHKITEGKIAYLGTENSAHYILQSGLEHIAVRDIDLENVDDISAFVFLDDEGFDWNTDINKTINLLRRKNIPVVVANSDKLYPVSNNDVAIAAGAISGLVENVLNRKFIHFGKPDTQMFTYAYNRLKRLQPITKKDILMVGDNLHTDILGGNKFGVKTALVLSGNTSERSVEQHVVATGIIPDFVCRSVVG
jgi:HAD superfamily hydrolase (TIGR01450 family)